MTDRSLPRQRWYRRLLLEPMVHFFILGAMLFGARHFFVGDDGRQVVVSRGVIEHLQRRFLDDKGRLPDPTEQAELLSDWKRDEALYQEALRMDLERNDAAIRQVLIQKMNSQAALEVSPPEPTHAELEVWFHAHRDQYELPRRYDFQYFAFPKAVTAPNTRSESNAEEQLAEARAALDAGREPSALGRSLFGGKLTDEDLPRRLPAPLADGIVQLKPGPWVRLEGEQDLWLLRVKEVSGGLPQLSNIQERVSADWRAAWEKEAIARVLQKTVALYHFEEAGVEEAGVEEAGVEEAGVEEAGVEEAGDAD